MFKSVALSTLLVLGVLGCGDSRQPWLLKSVSDWREATDSYQGVATGEAGLVLEGASEGTWTSGWHDWSGPIESARVTTTARLDLFGAKTIEVLVDGSEKPFTDAKGITHDWYGRCMIAILDENRWVMAVRSGVDHISWDDWDAIHILTSSDEGRTWGGLNRWFDGTPIEGMPFDDGYTHSEPGLFRMPNGDLILQFWRTAYSTGTKQLRSRDQGKTWELDLDRISVEGVTGADDDRAIGTEDYFVDPENPTHVYMAFQYFHYDSRAGTLLARSTDDGSSYSFLSWIGPLSDEKQPQGGATFEPAIEYVGNRTIVAILRDGAGNRYTWQTTSTDMGASFSPWRRSRPRSAAAFPTVAGNEPGSTRKAIPIFSTTIRWITAKGRGVSGVSAFTAWEGDTLASPSSIGQTTTAAPGRVRNCCMDPCVLEPPPVTVI